MIYGTKGGGATVRVGLGYDIHRLGPGRPLILGGVEIPHDRGLLGHSDADVLIHAIMDALLGAAGLPDIGQQFPNTDPRWAGASSLGLLDQVVAKVRSAGWQPVNVDVAVICETPRLGPHIPAMQARLAPVLRLPVGAVGIKATTAEGLGELGAGAGIAAHAVALLEAIPPAPGLRRT